MAQVKNILIIGGGLAGSFAAAEAALRGHRVTLVDLPNPKAASRVAAGLYNVITGREAKKTWLAEEMLGALRSFFARPAFAHLRPLLHDLPIYKPFLNAQQYNDWMVRLQQPDMAALAEHVAVPLLPDVIPNPLGGLRITVCGWAEVGPLCEGIVATLEADFGLKRLRSHMDYTLLNPATGECTLSGATEIFDEILCAEGLGLTGNPWFPWVELRPLKGQIIDVEMGPGLGDAQVLLRKTFLIPKGNNFYTAGSTYEPRFADDEPTPEGIETLETLVREQVSLPVRTVAARAALRPTTPNRRPILGRHPEFPRLAILNGLGTKGVVQAPLMAQWLREWLDGDRAELPKEVLVTRFLKNFV